MIEGFSRLSQEEKTDALVHWLKEASGTKDLLHRFRHPDPELNTLFSEISENTVSSYFLPFSIAPNFLVNGQMYMVPMVTEESSVVASASSAARFWATRNGFRVQVAGSRKYGQIHFTWEGTHGQLSASMEELASELRQAARRHTERMEQRGGGILDFSLHQLNLPSGRAYQLLIAFSTADSMGANFINTCLEAMAPRLKDFLQHRFPGYSFELIMSILSNYNPECLVEAVVQCPVENLEMKGTGLSGSEFAKKFRLAVEIAQEDVFRAVTNNKGIFNGIDAVVLATGNDFRAVEAGGHAWAAKDGKYRSLSRADVSDGVFSLSISLPLALGTVGGLTSIHPLAAFSIRLLGNPSAVDLMQIVASAGLANHFAAIRSLISSGIQQGHMKMHLPNILRNLDATENEKNAALVHFKNKPVSYAAVRGFLDEYRKNPS